MKKILLAILISTFLTPSLNASDYVDTILPGKWNVEGTSFIEKGIVRLSIKVEGTANQTTDELKNLAENIDKIIDNNEEKARNIINENRRVLTGCELDLRLYIFDKAGFDIKAWNEYIENAVKIPVLLPEMRPTISDPFILPSVTYNNLNYTLTFESESSGKLRVKGYVDVDTVGTCEINADCALWRDGTTKPELDKETSSGCNSGYGIFAACIAFIVLLILGRGTKFCSGQI